MSETEKKPEWKYGLSETEVELQGPNGKRAAPALVHENCPGLAVTMQPFGVFTVTHVSTGLKLCNEYQRASSAVLAMSQFALVAGMKETTWAELDNDSAVKLIKDLDSEPVPFDGYTSTSKDGTRNMTVSEWFQAVRFPLFDEFPWEDRDPFDDALENFEKVGEVK